MGTQGTLVPSWTTVWGRRALSSGKAGQHIKVKARCSEEWLLGLVVPSLLCTDLNACRFTAPPRWTGAVFIQLWGETEQMWDFLQGL